MCEPLRKGFMVRITQDERGPVTLIWLTKEMGCARCNTAHVAMRNRGGQTLCARCDELKQEAA